MGHMHGGVCERVYESWGLTRGPQAKPQAPFLSCTDVTSPCDREWTA